MQNDVKQLDREAYVKIAYGDERPHEAERILKGARDSYDGVQTLAAHRIAAEAAKDAEIAALKAMLDAMIGEFDNQEDAASVHRDALLADAKQLIGYEQ